MKTSNLIILIFLVIQMSCTEKSKESIEKTWNLVYFKWTFPDSTILQFPGNIIDCSGKWILLDGNSLFYYRYKTASDSGYTTDLWDIKYKFDGSKYEETYLLGPDEKLIGQTFHYKISFVNDTLILSGPEKDESEKLGCVVIEKYIRE